MKKAILVVSFGSSYEDTLKKNIEKIETDIADTFQEYTVRRAFTSSMIIRKLRNKGVDINNPEEALERLIIDGYKEIYIQPLHIIPGFEFEKIRHAVNMTRHKYKDVKMTMSTPLLYEHKDYVTLIDSLNLDLKPKTSKEGYLFMGHGTTHPANALYSQLQNMWRDQRDDVIISNVEGYPEIDDIVDRVVDNFDTITLIPLMIVAGDHAMNDMASNNEDSFMSILGSKGIDVTCILKGLGERKAVRNIFINKIKDII